MSRTVEELKKIYKKIDCANYIACNQNNDSCEDCPYDSRKGCIFDEIKEDMERLIIDVKYGDKNEQNSTL